MSIQKSLELAGTEELGCWELPDMGPLLTHLSAPWQQFHRCQTLAHLMCE